MAKAERQKPQKPRPDFPLFPHATGRWAKKIRGQLHYFGPWADPEAALGKYLDQKDDLQAGRKPRAKTDGPTVRDLINRFLTVKRHLVDTREMSPRTFNSYHITCLAVADLIGKTRAVSDLHPDDFETLRSELSKGRGPVTLGNEIRRIRTLFRYAHDAGLTDEPVRLGPTFKSPGKRIIRQARKAAGPRMFEAADLRRILAAADQPLRAMILIGINAGFGQTDCSTLPRSAADLSKGWIDFPRPKTGVDRRVPLWPETVAALTEAITLRPKPRDPADEPLVFLTRLGRRWVRMHRRETIEPGKPEWTQIDSVVLMFGRLLKEVGLKRKGLGFYAIRHTFETVAGESRDQVAVNAVMGHDPGDMASLYRERISDERLRAVTEHVRTWLYTSAGGTV